jgi:hypothetical protein
VQIRVAVLTVAGLAGAVYVGGVLLVEHSLAGRAALVAFAALAAYTLAGRTRGAVPLALGVLAVGVGVIAEKDVTEFGWFAYAPLSQSRPVPLDWSAALASHRRLVVAAALFAGGLLAVLGLTKRSSAPAVVLPEDPGDSVEA